MMVALAIGDNSLSSIISQEILGKIITGELSPGDKLVENDYADKFGTSRAPVREAIYLLTTEGLVERIPRRGAVVKEYAYTDIVDLLEIRNTLETMALLRINLSTVSEKEISALQNILIEMNQVTDTYEYAKLNHAFHLRIVEMSGSQSILDVYSRLGWQLLRMQFLSFTQKGNIAKSITEHEGIMSHIINGKQTELIELMTKHNSYVVSSVSKLMTLKKVSE